MMDNCQLRCIKQYGVSDQLKLRLGRPPITVDLQSDSNVTLYHRFFETYHAILPKCYERRIEDANRTRQSNHDSSQASTVAYRIRSRAPETVEAGNTVEKKSIVS